MAVASPETYLADLNPAQRDAVLHTEGPLLVVAGAGSGKTRVLTYRVAHLILAAGVQPNEILAITFTNKAAGEARQRWQKAFRYVLVDEYQDTNHAQYRLLQLLADKHRNVCAVGDPDQSIYAFRGADIRNILEFERDFGGARLIALEQNYRSTNPGLPPANAVIAHNRERKPKNLWSELGDGDPVRVVEVEDEHAEARFVAAEVASLIEEGSSGAELAVFYR